MTSTLVLMLLCGMLTACASNAPRPTAELSRAATLTNVAERSGAQQYAGADLDRARDKLKRANYAADEGEQERARRLAEEAAIDAELAAAKASSANAQRSAQEIRDSISTLRAESARASSSNEAKP